MINVESIVTKFAESRCYVGGYHQWIYTRHEYSQRRDESSNLFYHGALLMLPKCPRQELYQMYLQAKQLSAENKDLVAVFSGRFRINKS
jgi:hypothetical protein